MKEKFKIMSEKSFFNIDALKFRGRGFFNKIDKDKKNYLKKFSFLISKKKLVCPLCKNKKISIFLKISSEYKILKCKKCTLKFPNVDFVSNKKYSSIIYDKYSNLNHRINITRTSKYRLKMMQERYDYCIKDNFKNPKSIKVIDYGCGNGLFIDFLKKKGVSASGIEVDEASTQKLINKKINFFKDIESTKSNSYDLCVMFDVLEHLTNPIKDLLKIRDKLKKNGKIIIYTPNIHSLAFELMGANQNQVYPYQHTLFFTKKSLDFLAKKTKFKVKSNETFGLDLMDYFFMREHFDKKKYFEIFKEFINKTQSLIDMSGYGNHFRIILKK